MVDNYGDKIPNVLRERAKELEREGKTCVFVAINAQCVALVAMADVLKPEARYVVDYLRYVCCI